MDGLCNLLSLAAVNFLGNVLDFRTYSAPNQAEDDVASDEQRNLLGKYDRCDITGDEHFAMCYARGAAITIFDWIRKHSTILTRDGTVIADLPSVYVCKLLRALVLYKNSAMEKQLPGAPHCSSADVVKQVENVAQCDKHISSLWNSWDKDYLPPKCFISFSTYGYSVTWSPDAFEGFQCEMLFSFHATLPNDP